MKNNHKFSFTPKNPRNQDIHEIKSFPNKNSLNKIELEEPKEESFYFLSPKKSKKNKSGEDNDDIYNTEMNNKKPLELFQDIPNDVTDNKKTLELKQKYNLNNYDCDNIIQDKSNISMSFSKLIMNENNSNDKINDISNSIVKYSLTTNTLEEIKNNCENMDKDKLSKFCESMINKKNSSKILNIFDIYNKTKNMKMNNINSIKNYKGDVIKNHISFFQNLKDKKQNDIKTKLIKRTPRNKTYMNNIDNIKNFYSENSEQKIDNQNQKIFYENSITTFNNSNPRKKFNSLINSARTYSLIQNNSLKINNQNSLYINSTNRNRNNKNRSEIKNLSYSKFIYKKRIIKMNQRRINKEIFKQEKSPKNKESLINNICTRTFRKEKDIFNTFRVNNIKTMKRKSALELKLGTKNDGPINLKNNNFYSGIYESLLNKQKENCKNNIIIQNFNNYNLNTYNSNKNINPNFINFDNYNENNLIERKMNNTTERNDNKRKNIILDIKINKRCFSKNSERRNKKFNL